MSATRCPGRALAAGAAALGLWLALARPALAHPGAPPAPHDLLSAWTLEPATLLGLLLAGAAYFRGTRVLWRRAGRGHGVRRWQTASFAAGLLALVVALVSPLDALGTALFSAHMAQHLALMLVAAPLLALGAPLLPLLWALPERPRRAVGRAWKRAPAAQRLWRFASASLVAWLAHTAALWLWHMPALYQAALASETVHALEHASFLAVALLYWWTLLYPRGGRQGYGGGVLSLFATGLQGTALGALLTFSAAPWYPAYERSVAAWGLSPLQDQQLAGLAMWIPAGLVYLGAALALLGLWLQADEAAQRARPV